MTETTLEISKEVGNFEIAMAEKKQLNECTDLLMEILSRLPAKSLMRFKCVSKQWLSLITNPDFVVVHRGRKRNCGVNLVIPPKTVSHVKPWDCRFFMIDTTKPPSDRASVLKPDHKILLDVNARSNVVNGLVCSYCSKEVDGRVYLYNLSTREMLPLLTMDGYQRVNEDVVRECRLGYDPNSGKYKVVCVWRSENHMECHVLTLGDDEWRQIDSACDVLGSFSTRRLSLMEDFFPSPVSYVNEYYDEPGFCHDGVLYWTSHSFSSEFRKNVVIKFNVEKEEFTVINFPEEEPRAKLTQLRGQLSLASIPKNGKITVWRLLLDGEHNDNPSWIRDENSNVSNDPGSRLECSEAGLMSWVRFAETYSDTATIGGYDLSTDKCFKFKVNNPKGFLKSGRGPELLKMVENITPLKYI